MPYTFSTCSQDGYIALSHVGHVSPGELERGLIDSIGALSGTGINSFLIDVRGASALPDIGSFWFIIDKAAASPVLGSRTAILTSPKHEKIVSCIELFANNRNLDMQRFTDRLDAVRWLLHTAASIG